MGEACKAETGKSDFFFFLTPATQGKIGPSEPIVISLALSSKAAFRLFTALKEILSLHCHSP